MLALRLQARLGRGAYGEVWQAEDATGRPYAVKIMDSHHAKFAIDRVQRERDLLAKLKSPHVVHLYASFAKDDFFFLVQELLPGGSVTHLQEAWQAAHPGGPPGLAEHLAAHIFAQAVHAVAAIHNLGAAHRDIKPDNLLLDPQGRVRLIDLGLAAQAEASPPSPVSSHVPFGSSPPPYSGTFISTSPLSMHGFSSSPSLSSLSSSPVAYSALGADFDDLRCSAVGSPLYRAPETFAEGARRAAYSARKADVWSLGVLLHELLTGAYCLAPDPDDLPALRAHLRAYASGRAPLYWPPECTASPAAQDLVMQLLHPRPAQRPSLSSILSHPFVANVDVSLPLPWLPPPPPAPEAGRPPIERAVVSRLWAPRESAFAYGPPVTFVRV